MPKKTDGLKQVQQAMKLLKKANKLRETTTAPGDNRYAHLGMVRSKELIHKTISDRFYRDYNLRIPLTLLLKYAMDAVDDGRIKLPDVAGAHQQLHDLINAEDGKQPVVKSYALSPFNIMSGKNDDGSPIPPNVLEIGRNAFKKMQEEGMMDVPFPFSAMFERDPMDAVKEDVESKAPGADDPNIIRFTDSPEETNHSHDL